MSSAILGPTVSARLLPALYARREELKRQQEAAELAETSLRAFVEQAWHVVEPATQFVTGWHLDAIF
jgi:hypothetical protein